MFEYREHSANENFFCTHGTEPDYVFEGFVV